MSVNDSACGTEAIILNTIFDADHCINNGLHKNRILFSTLASIDVYLEDKYRVECRCLSNFINLPETLKIKTDASRIVENALSEAEIKVSPEINELLGLSMRYFEPTYSYLGKQLVAGKLCFIKALNNAVEKHRIKKICFYNKTFNSFLDINSDLRKWIIAYFPFLDIKEIIAPLRESKKPSLALAVIRSFEAILRASKRNVSILLMMYTNKTNFLYFFKKHKNILIYEDLMSAAFLKTLLKNLNILYYLPNAKSPWGRRSMRHYISAVNIKSLFSKCESTDQQESEFLEEMREDFIKNADSLLGAIHQIDTLNKKYPLALGIWGNSPVEKHKALIFEFLMSKKIKVIGAQHGCIFGDSLEPWHFDCDFSRCDYFISYGFTQKDLARLYPDKQIKVKIEPLGGAEPTKKNSKQEIVDIIFPLANTASLFEGGMMRTPPHLLTESQIKILNYLKTLDKEKIVIKPFKDSNVNNCAIIPLLKDLDNIRVVNDVTLSDFLIAHHPRIAILEYPSSPLFDVIHFDTEIFLLQNPLNPYDKNAKEELSKRVHLADTVEELIKLVSLFLQNKLFSKRDQTFYNHYVFHRGSKEKILNFINNLIV